MTKYSLMIGLNYENTKMELNGCINDIYSVKDLAINHLHIKPDNIIIMHDGLSEKSDLYPDDDNICKVLQKMVAKCKKDDLLLLHYSGHGLKSIESHECIYPANAVNSKKNYLCEPRISSIVSKLHKDATLFVLSDSCNTKAIIDFTYVVSNIDGQKDQYKLKKRDGQKHENGADMICVTASSGSEKAYDVVDAEGKAYGVITHVFCKILASRIKSKKALSYLDLLTELTEETKVYKQTPHLSFSKQACMTCVVPLMLKD